MHRWNINWWVSAIIVAEQRLQFHVSQRCSMRPWFHIVNADASSVDFPELFHFFFLTKSSSPWRYCLGSWIHYLPILAFLGESCTISLCYIILKPSCHMNILWKNEGKVMPPSASCLTAAQRTCQLHRGMHFSYLCCSKIKDTLQTIHWYKLVVSKWRWFQGDLWQTGAFYREARHSSMFQHAQHKLAPGTLKHYETEWVFARLSTPGCKKVRNYRRRVWGDGIKNAKEQGQAGAQQEAEVLGESEAEGRCEELKQGKEAGVGETWWRSGVAAGWG